MAREDTLRGLAFEKAFADVIEGRPQPGSGGGFTAKLDVKSSKFFVSCKSTKHETFSLNPTKLFRELKRHMTGVGGEGLGLSPVLALDIDGEVYVVQRCADWIDLLTSEEVGTMFTPTKAQQRKINARKRPWERGE